jgi:hypothetical protein
MVDANLVVTRYDDKRQDQSAGYAKIGSTCCANGKLDVTPGF